jgi:hypothetical protein
MAKMRPPRIPEAPPHVLRDEELTRLLKQVDGDKTFAGRRDAAIIRLFIASGARLSEITNLRWNPNDPTTNDGSAVYAGHCLADARELVEREAEPLDERPVWLFSSGPLGEPLGPEGDPVDVAAIVEWTGARDHQVFGGRIDRGALGFGERAVGAALCVPDGDFRPWSEIRAWATEIADAVMAGHGGWEREAVVTARGREPAGRRTG